MTEVGQGYFVVDGFLGAAACEEVRAEAMQLFESGRMRGAHMSLGADRWQDPAIRGTLQRSPDAYEISAEVT